MDRNAKAAIIDALRVKAGKAQIMVVTDFKGLKVEEMTDLRVKLRAQQIELQVVKNTLARIAFTESAFKPLGDVLKENCAVVIGYDDPVLAAKVITDYAKSNKKFTIRYANLQGKQISDEGLKNLSKLPSRPELLAQALGTMRAVPQNFVSLLANVPRSFLNVLTAIKDEKEKATA